MTDKIAAIYKYRDLSGAVVTEPRLNQVAYREKPAADRLNGVKLEAFIYRACLSCGKGSWVTFLKSKPSTLRCLVCANRENARKHEGINNSGWKGGRIKDGRGYIRFKLYPNDFFYPMVNRTSGYVLEHRLVMAKHLNRCLLPWEIVHHKNGVKDDNRIENLQILPSVKYHSDDASIKARLKILLRQLEALRKENAELKECLRIGK